MAVLGVGVLALALSGVIPGLASQAPAGAPNADQSAALIPGPAPGGSLLLARGRITPIARSRRLAGGSRLARGSSVPAGISPAEASTRVGYSSHVIIGDPSPVQAQRDLAVYLDTTSTHISKRWMQGFYPIYATAQQTFGVNWLLIASIHRQESAFSTAPGIYQGLNFAGCCGGPMQFNVTNGPVTTWSLVSDSYRYGPRPAAYDHMTARHPSIYDDFDAIMAAAHLLSADGAGQQLDGSAWGAAYDYYGHDLTGVTYADQVLARAIAWSQKGFCINCGTPQAMVEAVQAAYGAPVAAALEAEAAAAARAAKPRPRPPARSARPPRGR
jgi:hypothetical protein